MNHLHKTSMRLLVAALGLTLAVAGCGGGKKKTTTTAAGSIKPPANIASAGQIVFCSDVTYPPEEFFQGTKIVGSDIDIGTAAAKLMGVKAAFDNTGFEGIIPALLSKKCDAIISAMNNTPERAKQVNFVNYIAAGQSVMVRKGNPEHITTLADLSGKSVSVETGTTNKDFLDAQTKKFKSQGKKGIDVVTFPKDTDAAIALKTGKVDAYFGDTPPVAYYTRKDPKSFQFGVTPVLPVPIGIALRKEDTELRAAFVKAINALHDNGTIQRVLVKWKLDEAGVKPLRP